MAGAAGHPVKRKAAVCCRFSSWTLSARLESGCPRYILHLCLVIKIVPSYLVNAVKSGCRLRKII